MCERTGSRKCQIYKVQTASFVFLFGDSGVDVVVRGVVGGDVVPSSTRLGSSSGCSL
jgi:hypothetical protein